MQPLANVQLTHEVEIQISPLSLLFMLIVGLILIGISKL